MQWHFVLLFIFSAYCFENRHKVTCFSLIRQYLFIGIAIFYFFLSLLTSCDSLIVKSIQFGMDSMRGVFLILISWYCEKELKAVILQLLKKSCTIKKR